MIHGKTKIELYNPNTKIKNIIKSENTFQSNVLADYFRTFGEASSSPFQAGNYDNNNLWKTALGGIFLFKNPEEVGNKFMTAGNKMVGNGSYGLSNTGAPTELGSYNSSESSESASVIKQVYDFTTAQANDRISCVCLTSRAGGYIGYGNVASQQYHSPRSYGLYSFQSYRASVNTNIGLYAGDWYIEPSGDYSNGKLRIVKTRRSLLTGSVFNGYSKTLEFDLATIGNGYNLSGTYGYGAEKIFDVGNGIFRWIPNQPQKDISPNGTIYYYEYDSNNDTVTQKSFTNSSNNTVTVVGNGWTEVTHTYFLGKYAIVLVGNPTQGSGYIAEVFDTTNSVHMKSLNIRNIAGAGTAFRRHFTYPLGDALFAFNGTGSGLAYIYDIEADTVAPMNMIVQTSYSWTQNPSLWEGALAKEAPSYNSTWSSYAGIIHNPLYLATINNLDPFVTKSQAQTMKVTYTLTEVE